MNGHVIPDTPVAIDFWKIRLCPHVKYFFLTHLHSDHTVGLSSSWQRPIYCSEITGKLLQHKYNIKPDLIKMLEINSSCMLPLDEENKHSLTVTAIDANHCPGSVIFLLEGYFGRILYTGDFRYNPSFNYSFLKDIDVLYLDNTYCSPSCTFMSRSEAEEKIIEIVRRHPDHDIVFAMRQLGKHELLVKIALEQQERIGVSTAMLKCLDILNVPDVFLDHECRLTAVPFHKVTCRYVQQLNKVRPTVAILPTALYEGLDVNPYANQPNIFIVPYSDHSSYNELKEFVCCVHPKQIIPIVSEKAKGPFGISFSSRVDMSCFSALCSQQPRADFEIPSSVKTAMKSRNICWSSDVSLKKKRSRSRITIAKRTSVRGVVFESLDCSTKLDNVFNHMKSGAEPGKNADLIKSDVAEEIPILEICKQFPSSTEESEECMEVGPQNGKSNQDEVQRNSVLFQHKKSTEEWSQAENTFLFNSDNITGKSNFVSFDPKPCATANENDLLVERSCDFTDSRLFSKDAALVDCFNAEAYVATDICGLKATEVENNKHTNERELDITAVKQNIDHSSTNTGNVGSDVEKSEINDDANQSSKITSTKDILVPELDISVVKADITADDEPLARRSETAIVTKFIRSSVDFPGKCVCLADVTAKENICKAIAFPSEKSSSTTIEICSKSVGGATVPLKVGTDHGCILHHLALAPEQGNNAREDGLFDSCQTSVDRFKRKSTFSSLFPYTQHRSLASSNSLGQKMLPLFCRTNNTYSMDRFYKTVGGWLKRNRTGIFPDICSLSESD